MGMLKYFPVGSAKRSSYLSLVCLGGHLGSSLIDLRFMLNGDVRYWSPYFGDM